MAHGETNDITGPMTSHDPDRSRT